MSDTVLLALIAGFFGFLNSAVVLLSRYWQWKAEGKLQDTADSTHKIVNNQRTEMVNQIDDLKKAVANKNSGANDG